MLGHRDAGKPERINAETLGRKQAGVGMLCSGAASVHLRKPRPRRGRGPTAFARRLRHALEHALQLAAQHGRLEAGRNVGEAVGREAELLQCLGEQIQIQIGSTGRSRP